ncbi:MAG: PepSY domain-containing protein [Deltaproteobacteria bacterium]|nr:PepSY domain-containing protein [Deltaproteobacteria bacterium]
MIDRRRVYALHGAIARVLGAALVVVLATGTLATLSVELERLLEPEGAHGLELGALASIDAWAERSSRTLRIIDLDGARGALAWTVDSDGRWSRTFLDRSGAPRGTFSFLGARAVLRDVHRQLFVGHVALYVTTPLSFVLLAMMVSGYLSQRRLVLGIVGTSPHARRASLHRSLGTLGLLPGLLFALTGLVYVTETIVEELGASLEITPPASVGDAPSASTTLPLDALLTRAVEASPTLSPRRIVLPRERGRPLLVWGPGATAGVRDLSSFVAIDPRTGAVLAQHEAGSAAPLDLAADLVDPLHFGDVGGAVTRYAWCLFGVLLTALTITGLATGRARRRHDDEHRLERRMSLAIGFVFFATLLGNVMSRREDLAPSGWLAVTLVVVIAAAGIALAARTPRASA